ncbi:MAG TPA: radical SAM protein [Chitinophagaceae bacterium]|nr:radical SAM protein [Chitinophagaceae bacterium]
MQNILFTHSYFLKLDPKQWRAGQPYAPLGTLYAAALMRSKGYKVSLYDSMFAHSPNAVTDTIDKIQPGIFAVYDDGFNYLTKMCLTNMREAAFTMMKLAKERGCVVIVSSSDSTDHYKEYLANGADFVIIGEAEQTLLQLVNAITCGVNDFSAIEGIAFEAGGNIIKTARRSVMKDLDLLPMPAWDIIDIKPYRDMWMFSTGYFSMNVATTRGCPFKCNWCAKPIYGNRYNSRSPEHVIAELKLLKQQFSFDHIWFCDDIFGLKPGWVQHFADLAEKESLSFKFKIQARADLLLQEDYIKALARAGCDDVWMGAESGSQKILDAMDKGITIKQIEEATALLKLYGIKPSFFIQFGYPGEMKEDIAKTIAMINRLLPHNIGISVSYPLPGTKFYEKVKAGMQEKTNWTDSDELQLMFSNTYKPAFYKQLHRYVHTTFRLHKAMNAIKKIFAQPSLTSLRNARKVVSLLYHLPAAYIAKRKLDMLEKV